MTEHMHPQNHEHLEINDQITLQAVSESEASDLFRLTDNNRDHLSEFLPWVGGVNAEADSLAFIKSIQEDRKDGAQYGFGIYFDGALVGHASLMHVADEKPPEIGYWIAEDHTGRGITTQATKALERFGFETLGLSEIVIKAREDNLASNAIPKKLEYTLYETEDRDGEITNVWRKINEQQ